MADKRHSPATLPPAVCAQCVRLGVVVLGTLALAAAGCSVPRWMSHAGRASADPYIQAATAIEYPDLDLPIDQSAISSAPPVTILGDALPATREITLEESVHIALANSKVMRDIGGVLLRSPLATRTTYDPAAVETDPRFGVEAALSEFDASFAANLFYEHNDRALNNQFFGGGTRLLRQRTAPFQAQISKKNATGSEFFIRHLVNYDWNNAPGNVPPLPGNIWEVMFEAEFRQPLLQGAGADFNRIAGNSRVPGVYNGVLIARTNTDISLADFELSVRDFLSDVENAYWDLYFAYRDLDAKVAARNAALETWRRIQALAERERVGGEADKEAQAREQYYRFQEEVELALTGRLNDATRTYNGSGGGTFRPIGGVHVAERRLRFLIGLPINDGGLLRPIDEPVQAPIDFNWDLSIAEAITKRAELRRQKWLIKRRELELIAARNFLKPDFDLVGLYRWRGLGRTLLDPDSDNSTPFDNAWDTLVGGDFQEWMLGGELTFPFGNRRAHAGVRNAEVLLARDRALLKEQEQRIVHDLSNAKADVERAQVVLQTVYNRLEAAREQLAALQTAFEADKAPLNLVLEAQRRLAAAESRYYEALVDHAIAVKNMHFEKGSLLEYAGVHLAEGPWPEKAFEDAAERLELRSDPLIDELTPGHRVITE